MSDNVPPPPGGYGTPYRVPQAPPPLPPDDLPPPPRNTGRWAAGGIGLVLLGLRACLLFARLDDTTPSYNYTPLTLPTYDPLAGFNFDAAVPMPKLPVRGGHVATSGDKVVFDDSNGEIKDSDGKVLCSGYCTTNELAIAGGKVVWISYLEHDVRGVPVAGGTPQKVASLKDPGIRLATDGTSVFVVDADSDDEASTKKAIVKIDVATGKQSKLTTIDGTIDDLTAGGGKVFFAWSSDDAPGVRHLRAVSTSGGAVTKLADASIDEGYLAGAVGGGYYYLAYGDFTVPEHIGRVPVSGGAFETIYDASADELLGPIAADGTGLYVARRVAGWSIAHLNGGPKADAIDLEVEVASAPQSLALRKNDVVFADDVAVVVAPKTASKAR